MILGECCSKIHFNGDFHSPELVVYTLEYFMDDAWDVMVTSTAQNLHIHDSTLWTMHGMHITRGKALH